LLGRLNRRAGGPLPLSGRPSESDWLAAAGHPHRVEIMRCLLASGTATPSDIANALRLPVGTISYHVRFLADHRILRLTGRTQRRGATVHHYQLSDRGRAASMLWGLRAALLVTDFEREDGRGDATVRLDAEALVELHELTSSYLASIGELGLQTRERRNSGDSEDALTAVAVLLAMDHVGKALGPT